jgi:hypothetical protein
VETQARLMHVEVLRELLDKSEESQVQQKCEVLRMFLETADFPKLRAESKKFLAQNKIVVFHIRVKEGKSQWEIKTLP